MSCGSSHGPLPSSGSLLVIETRRTPGDVSQSSAAVIVARMVVNAWSGGRGTVGWSDPVRVGGEIEEQPALGMVHNLQSPV